MTSTVTVDVDPKLMGLLNMVKETYSRVEGKYKVVRYYNEHGGYSSEYSIETPNEIICTLAELSYHISDMIELLMLTEVSYRVNMSADLCHTYLKLFSEESLSLYIRLRALEIRHSGLKPEQVHHHSIRPKAPPTVEYTGCPSRVGFWSTIWGCLTTKRG